MVMSDTETTLKRCCFIGRCVQKAGGDGDYRRLQFYYEGKAEILRRSALLDVLNDTLH